MHPSKVVGVLFKTLSSENTYYLKLPCQVKVTVVWLTVRSLTEGPMFQVNGTIIPHLIIHLLCHIHHYYYS